MAFMAPQPPTIFATTADVMGHLRLSTRDTSDHIRGTSVGAGFLVRSVSLISPRSQASPKSGLPR